MKKSKQSSPAAHAPSPRSRIRFDAVLFSVSCLLIISSFLIFDRRIFITLAASLFGVSSLMLTAKGNPLGQLFMIIFSLLYGIISLGFSYYGEMITYLGMTAPMAVLSLISWLKNPFNGRRSEVKVGHLGRREIPLMFALATVVTLGFFLSWMRSARPTCCQVRYPLPRAFLPRTLHSGAVSCFRSPTRPTM